MQSKPKNSPKIWYDPGIEWDEDTIKFQKIPKKKKLVGEKKEKRHGSNKDQEE